MRRMFVLATVVAAAIAVTNGSAASRIDPGNFGRAIDNPWFPLRPGTTYVYRGMKDQKPARDVMIVMRRTKTILGVPCVVVQDNNYIDGRLVERTADWYTQDRQGNVWYFGEATAELDDYGKVKSTEGSWQAGVDGARAGIIMQAHPKVGQAYLQEYYKGYAEDHARIVSLKARVTSPFVSSKQALLTREWTPLEPGIIDLKYYVRGVGVVRNLVADERESFALVSVARW